jgi:SAM-dependent methyltransferase
MSKIEDAVREKYGAVAASGLTGADAGVRAVAEAFGYTADELAALPAEANMGLSCGNPTASAGLRPGEVVVDLGCGGGIDVLLAAKKVGPAGKAIGIDMTPEMIGRANRNAAAAGVTNAEFHLARMEAMPLPDGSADCLISNCVVNLAPDKPAVFREMFRVLKPGGRVAVSDIALRRDLPPELATDVAAYVGCVAGAIPVAAYERMLTEAGLAGVRVIDAGKDLNAYAKVDAASACCGSGAPAPELHAELATLLGRFDVNDYAASVRVFAVKPADAAEPSPRSQEPTMTTLQVFDRPMCCSTGVCGPAVDPVLPTFAADLAWLKDRGVSVERYNLAQQPEAFVAHADIRAALGDEHALPLVRVNGEIVSRGVYPSRQMLAAWSGVSVVSSLPVSDAAAGGACCGPAGCC